MNNARIYQKYFLVLSIHHLCTSWDSKATRIVPSTN